jgi:UDP:flavonoid glycosyltransferase YjiC (YdhE family)
VRVLFVVSAWPTHYMSMVPLGWALQAAGHEVRVLCDQSQVDTVTHAGLVPAPFLEGTDVAVTNRMQYYWEAVHGDWRYPWLPLHPLTGEQMNSLDDFDLRHYRAEVEPAIAARAQRSFDAAVGFARAWRPDLVLHDPTSLEGLLVAHVLDVPAALFLWGPAGTHEADHMRVLPPDVSGSFPRYGLPELHPDLVGHVIDPCPATLAPPTTAERLPMRYIPYNGLGAAPKWLLDRPKRPRVCVVWSTALTRMSGPNSYALPKILRGLAGQGFEVLCTAMAHDVAALGEIAGSVRVLERFPLHLLLPSCDAVVHHGGAGSTMTALWAGVPQLAVTFASEQIITGERVAAAGAGRHLLGHLADSLSIGDAVRDLIAGSCQEGVAALRDELQQRPTPAEFVETLTKLALR